MMNSIVLASLSQLLILIPTFIVYLTGFILALVFWKRCPIACLFALIAVVVLTIITVTQPFLIQYIIQTRAANGGSISAMSTKLAIIGIIYSLFHAASMGLLITAVFLKRKPSVLQMASPNQ